MTDFVFDTDKMAGGIVTELTEQAEEEFIGKRDNLTFQTIEKAHEILRQAAEVNNYRVESIIDSLELTQTAEHGDELVISFGWGHDAAEYFERGTSGHTIQGQPIISFVWERRHNPPRWVREQFDEERTADGSVGYRTFLRSTDVRGIKEIRFLRRALEWLQRELKAAEGEGRPV